MTYAPLPPRRRRSARHLVGGLSVVLLLAAACGDDSATTEASGAAVGSVTDQVVADATPSVLPGAGVTVTPGRATWSTGYFQAAVYSALLEELGYTVTEPSVNEYDPSEAYLVMAEGLIDFWANGWYPQHEVWQAVELADGSLVSDHLVVIGEEMADAGLQGMIITRSVAAEHGITSLDQIDADPELAALFDVDGNGVGDILGCEEEWTCDNVIDEMIGFNGWSNLEQVKAGYEGLVATAIERVDAGQPVIAYTWSPTGYLDLLRPGDNVLWLNVGDETNVLDGSTDGGFSFVDAGPVSLGETCTADPCWPGWEVDDVLVTANREFAEANPVAAALFEVVKLEVAAVAAQNRLYDGGENTEADVERHAAEWIEANRVMVDEWIAHALAAA